ncbi:MAG: hypothetical protein DHS20C16_19250 [Phycisphaerae bacterium]|nr:MAG: hypothetical protein DHS20C16_19250 [Phycisphaerae bacterium]
MLLVPDQKPPAGDFVLILTTLTVLQAYEMLVTSILIALRHNIRAPEDQPSILIIGTIFWTGPLIATMEMTAANPTLGFALALGAVAIAIGEVMCVAKTFGWKLGRATVVSTFVFLFIVAMAQPVLRESMGEEGVNEVLLYALWWVVAGAILLSGMFVTRVEDLRVCGGLVAAAAGAAMLHLFAMNHAFVGHARAFYVVPVLAAIAMVALRFRERFGNREWLGAILCLPALGIGLSVDRFSNAVSFDGAFLVYVDPLFIAFMLAGIVWWRGHVLLGWEYLRHAAAIVLIWTATRGAFLDLERRGVTSDFFGDLLDNGQQGVGLLVAAWYLFAIAWFRRSRALCAVGLILNQIVISKLLPEVWSDSDFVCVATAGWSALLFTHVVVKRISLAWRLVPITFLVVAGWAFVVESNSALEAHIAKVHCGAIIVVLMAAGFAMPWTRYRTVATVIAIFNAIPHIIHWVRHHPQGPATTVIITGFALLAVAAMISWNKQSLLSTDELSPECTDSSDAIESVAEG